MTTHQTNPAAAAHLEHQTEPLASPRERTLVLWLTNVSHAVNHFQNQMLSVLLPVMMAELGFGYAQLGVLTAVQQMFNSATQAAYGFLAPFARRTRLLGIGNLIMAAGTVLTGLVPSYQVLIGTRALASIGSSAQHPVGSSLLAGYFPRRRGTILALNNSIANIGSLVAPLLAGALLYVLGWRQIFFVVAIASLAMGVPYLLFRDRSASVATTSSRRARLARGKASYLRVLRNRNMLIVSLVMMVGAAGRGEGVNLTYIGPHLVNDLGLALSVAGLALSTLQLGSIVGPLAFGWLSDRLSRKYVIQASLLLSSLATWWLAYQGPELPILLLNMLIYGAVGYSRNTLTQALVADSLTDDDRDAAFSVYYFIGFASNPAWALLTGLIMEAAGFSFAFSVLGFSYIAGMVLMLFVDDRRSGRREGTA